MNKSISSLYKSFNKMTEKQLLAFLGMYFNKVGLENMTTYFVLDSMASVHSPDKEEIEKIKYVISRVKQLA